MKLFAFSILIILFPLIAIGQPKSGFIELEDENGKTYYKSIKYFETGKIKTITYWSIHEANLIKQDRFMRGLEMDEEEVPYVGVDSIFFYSESGDFIRKMIISEDDHLELGQLRRYDDEFIYTSLWKRYNSSLIVALGNTQLEIKSNTIQLEGRIGESITFPFEIKLWESQTESLVLYLESPDNQISVPDSILLRKDQKTVVDLVIAINQHIDEVTVLALTSSGESFPLEFSVRGYDLFQNDFQADLNTAQRGLVDLGDKRKLIIKSDGPEKLIRLYRNENLIDHYPISQIGSSINVKGFKKGTYVLELVNLGTQEKKYCAIELQ